MKNYIGKWKTCVQDKFFFRSFFAGFLFLGVSLILNYIGGTYASERASFPVTDIILNNIRVYDVDSMFVYGSVVFLIIMFFVLFYNPKRIPFSLKTIALFVIIRSIFISLTHIGPFPNQAIFDTGSLFYKFTFTGDLFFSGHVGLPFLMALIFWQNKYLRFMFLAVSLIFGIIVLMGHIHYSIDVFAAFFITYSIFQISKFFFKKDRQFFEKGALLHQNL